ncbi:MULTISPECIES: class I SAM-dependent methyltransferase [Bradyrhizobium]|uniref:Class I SAM-dependent methyltransferase n=1 Tax=Bradyrhizobium zhanjiangense TaxID=1325107 RepID=A0A4Q0SFF5_9BRAD|nr:MULTISPECIES: class I SAM-dependent methyltransferase [Bradyrhizobium]RXG90535.1 class I SAM-dependent methyltransferase [Bradyrhizobium zhanjiangense]RXH37882.1 phospholipid methyltransferase [Bradyrhizobium zhanjiangense]UQR59782.1 class I SAM-dependent methyltransferase [Bradyrhizobium sp. C-145]SDH38275.1 Ubiquinone/menaquinone biosynthesis C-methylase UbiE [Bradyrhizobium sp. Rc2d]
MSFYQDRILPWLTQLAMRQAQLVPYRTRVASAATGRVLELGIGPGLNLGFYGPSVTQIIGIDPSPKLLEVARNAGRQHASRLDLIEGSAEAIPLESSSVDTVVTTWTMCSIPNVNRALSEARRILKPGGQLLFVEHGRAPEPSVQWWQDRLTPPWKVIAGGCHLNRAIADLIRTNGFAVQDLNVGYMRGPKPMTFMYEGRALPRS